MPNFVGGQSYSYDANGNTLTSGGRSYEWNAENKPISITSSTSGTESYTYDANGERVSRSSGGTTTLYLEGLWEEVVGGQAKNLIAFGGKIVAQRVINTGQVDYLHGDHLGSASLVTGSSGGAGQPSLSSQQEFDPWGKVRTGAGLGTVTQTTINYTGQRLDGTGLLFYHARYYDPAIGKFISADPVTPASIDSRGLNRYTYVFNNPTRYADEKGYSPDRLLSIENPIEASDSRIEQQDAPSFMPGMVAFANASCAANSCKEELHQILELMQVIIIQQEEVEEEVRRQYGILDKLQTQLIYTQNPVTTDAIEREIEATRAKIEGLEAEIRQLQFIIDGLKLLYAAKKAECDRASNPPESENNPPPASSKPPISQTPITTDPPKQPTPPPVVPVPGY